MSDLDRDLSDLQVSDLDRDISYLDRDISDVSVRRVLTFAFGRAFTRLLFRLLFILLVYFFFPFFRFLFLSLTLHPPPPLLVVLVLQVKELEEWGEYSTNFSFRQGQGLPGRVYGTNKSEWQVEVVYHQQKYRCHEMWCDV